MLATASVLQILQGSVLSRKTWQHFVPLSTW